MSELVVENLRKEFPTRSAPLVVLDQVDLRMTSGQSVAVLGPSGSGKSTLLHIVGTLDEPTSGSVRLNDVDPFDLTERDLADFRNQQIGFVFQEHYLLPELSVVENVLIPVLAGSEATAEDRDRALELIERVGLQDRAEHRPGELSGGERGRAAIARALMRDPPLLLADEPTGNLDQKTAASVMDLLMELQRDRQMMLLVVTHSWMVAAKLDQRFELIEGRLVDAGEKAAAE